MDEDVLRAAFQAHTEGQPMFTRRMAITIGLQFDERPKIVVLNLEAMGLLRRGSWKWFSENGGITADQVDEVKRDLEGVH